MGAWARGGVRRKTDPGGIDVNPAQHEKWLEVGQHVVGAGAAKLLGVKRGVRARAVVACEFTGFGVPPSPRLVPRFGAVRAVEREVRHGHDPGHRFAVRVCRLEVSGQPLQLRLAARLAAKVLSVVHVEIKGDEVDQAKVRGEVP